MPKYKLTDEVMLAALRPLAEGRNRANALGLTDNHGAIHAVERVLDILRVHLADYGVSRSDQLKHANIKGTAEAFEARARGQRVEVEHVYPRREVAQEVCAMVMRGDTDRKLRNYIIKTSQVVLLTPEQRAMVDAVPGNRSRYMPARLKCVGLKVSRERPSRSASPRAGLRSRQ